MKPRAQLALIFLFSVIVILLWNLAPAPWGGLVAGPFCVFLMNLIYNYTEKKKEE